jgi:hypothetical protein
MAIVLPDSEILFRTWALEQSIITDQVSTRIATRLPSNATLPFAVINLMSSSAENIDSAPLWISMIEVSCYGGKYGSNNNKPNPDFASAFNLANAFVRSAFDFAGKKYTINGVESRLVGFNPIEGPYRIEDTDTELARYNVSIGMYYGEA